MSAPRMDPNSNPRPPNATQINGFTENPTPTTFVKLLSNPDLKPEKTHNYEVGTGSLDISGLGVGAYTRLLDRKSVV